MSLDLRQLCIDLFCEYFPPARGFLTGASWEEDSSGLCIILPNGGREALQRYISRVEDALSERAGKKIKLTIKSGQRAKEELLGESEKRRRASLKEAGALPRPVKKKAEVLMGRAVTGKSVPMKELSLDMKTAVVTGEVFAVNHREMRRRNAFFLSFDMTDYTSSVRVTRFMDAEEAKPLIARIKEGMVLTVSGRVEYDEYEKGLVISPQSICVGEKKLRQDSAPEKRVELHMHTRMSALDALTNCDKIVSTAARWNHHAIAVTDHGVAQSFPEMYSAGKKYGVKILYGVEAYYVNDMEGEKAACGEGDAMLDGEFVAFDIETTGLSATDDEIIEIGAVICKNGETGETFSTFVEPGRPIPARITELTGITDEMVRFAPGLAEALDAFLKFAGGRPLVAHNAGFDMSFIIEACRKTGRPAGFLYIDTLSLARALLPQLKRHKLDLVADCLGLPKFNHHRASDDAMTVALMLGRFTKELALKGITRTSELNSFVRQLIGTGGARHVYHITLLAKNRTGLRNMYKLISLAHLEHFYRHPVIPRNLLIENREGLLVGSACENSEVYSAVVSGKSWPEIRQIAEFYDYLEIQPVANNMFMVRRGTASDVEQLRRYNKSMVLLGEELCKPVCATGDVHFLEPEDEIFRRILLASKDYEDADEELPLYFRTTDEMLEEFSYLGEEKALEVVVKNPRIIADKCESIKPLPDGLFPPTIENSAEELKSLVYGRMREMYGDEPPQLVKDRVNIEMEAILSRNYDVIYMSAQKLVKKSLDAGYLVGSRGSVGSSIVAYLSGITEVNSLPPHYRCPNCRYSDFEAGKEYGCGVDMPDAFCPVCGEKYVKDGFNIPFETFLGYGGKKVPDIDLNFSGEYQARAHKYTSELFGENHVFRAGTISVYKDKTAYGIVRSYLDSRGIDAPRAEVDRLVKGCVGVKRTTGQHPGGMVVIPQDKEVYDFCPVQYPADNRDSGSVTTHFEYHSMEDNLLKLDILGHDDPTMIKLLEEMTGVDAKKIPLDDPETMSLFTSNRALGIENDSTLGPTGACAIPEFGTKFVREMLIDTKPTQFDTLIRISGFSHGTAVWLDNARDLILSGTATVNEAIGCRDDIMLYLISKGMDMEESFNIMESVRKGKGLKKDPNWEKDMREHGVPEWYIDSCNKIQYMFPKAHAVAYVIMAFRIAWFKVHYPLAFYAAYFSVRAKAFDATVMCRGLPAVKAKMKELKAKDKDASAVEQDMLVTLEVCYEFYLRGFSFLPIELMQSDATRFLIKDGKLLPPFSSIPGMGEAAAQSIADCRRSAEFVSVEEFAAASGISKTNLDLLRSLGALGNLPETNQLSLF